LRTAAAGTHRRGCAGSTANWRSDPLSRVINTRLPTSQPSALLYWARIRERQFPTIHNISRDGSVMYRRGQPLEREDASVIWNVSQPGLENGSTAYGRYQSRETISKTMWGCIVNRLKWLGQMILTLIDMRMAACLGRSSSCCGARRVSPLTDKQSSESLSVGCERSDGRLHSERFWNARHRAEPACLGRQLILVRLFREVALDGKRDIAAPKQLICEETPRFGLRP